MTNKEKVISGLECCSAMNGCECRKCPYSEECFNAYGIPHLATDALKLLKEQPDIVHCGECKHAEHWYRDKALCFLWHDSGIDVFEDGYCNYGERRSDVSTNNLKRCPFCGSNGKLKHRERLNTYIVECSNNSCPASYMIGYDYDTEEEAIKVWNTRVESES